MTDIADPDASWDHYTFTDPDGKTTVSEPHTIYDPDEEKVERYLAPGLKELGEAMAEAEAGDQPGPRRMARAIRSLWGMVFRAEETSVYWMNRAASQTIDVERLAKAIYEAGVRQTMSQSEQSARNILAEYARLRASDTDHE